jgi:hypothetical protein
MVKRLDAALGYSVGKQRVLDQWDEGRRYCVLGE